MNIGVAKYKNLKSFGLLEFLLVSYDLFLPYSIGPFGFEIIFTVLLWYLAVIKTGYKLYPTTKEFRLLILYVLLHQILICVVLIDDLPSYHINSLLLMFLNLGAIFVVVPAVDFEKFLNALKIVTILVMLGEAYHMIILLRGGEVSPIHIPFLPFDGGLTRLNEIGKRPVSFCLEPSNLAQFYIFPLFFSLYYRKWGFSVIIVFFILLTTSTNGVIFVGTMILAFLTTQHVSPKIRFGMIGIVLIFVVMFTSMEMFSKGKNKLEDTNVDTTSRLINGPLLVQAMPWEHLIVGFPAANSNDYIDKTEYVRGVPLIGHPLGGYFISSFWATIAKYGYVGLILFFVGYYSIYKKNKSLIYLLIPLLALKFSGGALFNSATFTWTSMMFVFIEYEKRSQRKFI